MNSIKEDARHPMVETSRIMTDAYELLRYDLYEHLDEAAALMRKLVTEHKDDANEQCGNCGAAWPCSVVRTVHEAVKDPKGEFVKLVDQAHANLLTIVEVCRPTWHGWPTRNTSY